MIEFKKSELTAVLGTICFFDIKDNRMLGGLLCEDISLGLKRRLQKLHKVVLNNYNEYLVQKKEVDLIKDEEKRAKELEELNNEVIKIDLEKLSLEMIESIRTKANYNFDLIEKFAE
jgi:hypothetical protein